MAAGYATLGQTNPGYIWTQAGRVDFGQAAGMPATTYAYAISGDGLTVVGDSRATLGAPARAFRWNGPGTYQTLGTAGYPRSYAEGVSGDGSVIVGRCENGAVEYNFGQAFRWTAAGGMQLLGYTRPGNVYSEATSVSRDGNTVVGYSFDANGSTDAFLWRAGTGVIPLPQLPGTPIGESAAWGVSRDGTFIVGQSGPVTTATMWVNGVPVDLGIPSGWTQGVARAVNDSGTVVVGHLTGSFPEPEAAAIWTPGRGEEPLVDYLLASGTIIPSGWYPIEARAVSADGNTIAGWAHDGTGQLQGFVATVPAPNATSLTLLAFGALLARNRAICTCN